jgi:uncharacterized cupin superfamily protein
MKDLEQKLKEILPRDKECVIVWHHLEPGESISEHAHDDYDEFVIIDNGNFSTHVDGEISEYSLTNETTLINFPVNSRHAFTNGGRPIEYFVVRVKFE